MRSILLGALLLTASIALLPEATAACEPGTDPDFCHGALQEIVVDGVEAAQRRLEPPADGCIPRCS